MLQCRACVIVVKLVFCLLRKVKMIIPQSFQDYFDLYEEDLAVENALDYMGEYCLYVLFKITPHPLL